MVDPGPDDADSVAAERATPDEDAREDEESPPSSTAGDTARHATQVGLASGPGDHRGHPAVLDPLVLGGHHRFVVYVGTSTSAPKVPWVRAPNGEELLPLLRTR